MADQPAPEEVRNALAQVDLRGDMSARQDGTLRAARVLAAECRRLESELAELRRPETIKWRLDFPALRGDSTVWMNDGVPLTYKLFYSCVKEEWWAQFEGCVIGRGTLHDCRMACERADREGATEAEQSEKGPGDG